MYYVEIEIERGDFIFVPEGDVWLSTDAPQIFTDYDAAAERAAQFHTGRVVNIRD
jgi:hypothetical protein